MLIYLMPMIYQRWRGPWLVCHETSGQIELPRAGKKLHKDEVRMVHMASEMLRFRSGGSSHSQRGYELSFLVAANGDRVERVPLVGSLNRKELLALAVALKTELGLRIDPEAA